MKTQIIGSTNAHLIRGTLCVALLVAGTLLSFFPLKTLAKRDQRTLTFAERVAYQRAIEDVYWRHRIWPKERPDPKPSLDAVMSQAQLENKVARLSAQLAGAGGLLAAANHCRAVAG